MSKFLVVILVLFLVGCATADWGQLADSTTTVIALESGFSEGNPLLAGSSWGVIVGVKLGVTQAVKVLPQPYCDGALFGLTVTGFGVALWNLGVILGSGVAALPLVGFLTWKQWEPWQEQAQFDCVRVDTTLREIGWR